MEKKPMGLFEKISLVQEGLSLDKDAKSHYSSYISLDNIIDKIKPLLKKHRLLLLNKNIAGGVETTIHDLDSTDKVYSIFILEANKDPQKYGAILTYGRRYNLTSIFNVVADSDDDCGSFYTCKTCGKTCTPGKQYCSEECYNKSKEAL